MIHNRIEKFAEERHDTNRPFVGASREANIIGAFCEKNLHLKKMHYLCVEFYSSFLLKIDVDV